MKTYLLAVLLICLQARGFAKPIKILHGRVQDAETGIDLPLANIQIKGTFRGTISNDAGRYRLEIPHLPAVLLVRYIGYQSQPVTISDSSPDSLDILLRPTVIPFREIVVTGEDPAVAILRKVIESKAAWRNRLRTFQAETYSRFNLENDSGIVSIAESVSELFWDLAKGMREVIKFQRETSNLTQSQNFASTHYVPNFYDDDIEMSGFKIVGPTHPKALDFYNVKLIGKRSLDDKIVFDIAIQPKNKLRPTFTGTISVLDEVFALLEIDLKPGPAVFFPPPLDSWDFYYKQQFSNFGQDFWLPVDVRIGGQVKIKITGVEFPLIKHNQISRLTNYQINIDLPDSLYASKKIIIRDSLSIRMDSLSALNHSRIPLTEGEQTAYESLDSTMTLARAFKPTGFLARMAVLSIRSEDEEVASTRDKKAKKSTPDLTPQLWFNRVDALHLGLKVQHPVRKKFSVRMEAGYNTGLKRASYGAGAVYRFTRQGQVSADYSAGTTPRNSSGLYPREVNGVVNLLGSTDYFDYFRNERFRFEGTLGFGKFPGAVQLALNTEKQSNVKKCTDFNLLGRDVIQPENPAIPAGTLNSIELKISFGENSAPWGMTGQKRLELFVEHSGAKLWRSDFEFTRYQLRLDYRLPIFLRRRLLPNVLDFRLVAGTATGDLPPQRIGVLDGALGAFTPFGAFKTIRNRPLEGDRYWALFWEHHFRTVPFELLGLRSLTRRGWGLLLHGASGQVWNNGLTGNSTPNPPAKTIHEIGLSVSGLFNFVRLDVTRGLTKETWFGGVSLAKMF